MQRLTILLFFCFISPLLCSAQKDEYLEIDIQISCGFAAVTSPIVDEVNKLVKRKAYSHLKLKLSSPNKSEALLSFIAIKELQTQQTLYLSPADLRKLSEIPKRKDKYSICYTCTGHFEGSTKELLSKVISPAYQLIKSAIFNAD